MNPEGINRRTLCTAAVAVTLVGISNQITPRAAAESKPAQARRVPALLDEQGRRNFHACRALPKLTGEDILGDLGEC